VNSSFNINDLSSFDIDTNLRTNSLRKSEMINYYPLTQYKKNLRRNHRNPKDLWKCQGLKVFGRTISLKLYHENWNSKEMKIMLLTTLRKYFIAIKTYYVKFLFFFNALFFIYFWALTFYFSFLYVLCLSSKRGLCWFLLYNSGFYQRWKS